ncbi:MAG: hypothetical protein JXR73_05710 [Candidatus Omnitrophica bacterium]|nr:hypothetical protein [Candidatus Omnitrophota bacterium]
MNDKRKPNLQDLSLYYDGLLDEEKRRQVEAFLENGGEEKRFLTMFECFDSALESDLSDDRIDALLSDNLKGVHERLIQEDRQRRKESASLWDWLLMPRNLLAGLASILLLFGVFSTFKPMDQSSPQNIMIAKGDPSPTPELNPVEKIISAKDGSVVDETQKQVILAAASLAKRAFSSSFDYAKEQGKPIGDSFKSLPQTADLGAAFQALTSSGAPAGDASTEAAESSFAPSQQLARSGARQLAIGIGASLLSLVSVI